MGGANRGKPQVRQPQLSLMEIFDECQHAATCHRRHVNSVLRNLQSSEEDFVDHFVHHVAYVVTSKVKSRAVDTLLQFIKLFLVKLSEESSPKSLEFLDQLLLAFSEWVGATDKTMRQRVVSLLSQAVISFSSELHLSEETCEVLREAFRARLSDKVSSTRAAAAKALQRFIVVEEDGDVSKDPTVVLLKSCLGVESSAEVREAILTALPESADTLSIVLESVADTSESVRVAAFNILGDKFFPLEGFSIRQRAEALKRGLTDDSDAVRKSCSRLLKQVWLERDCENNILTLLKLLDVEQHENVGDLAMEELATTEAYETFLSSCVSLRDFLGNSSPDEEKSEIQLLKPEEAFLWRWLVLNLTSQAVELGKAAATSVGASAAVATDQAEAKLKELDNLMPPSAADYVALVNAHIAAGMEHRFAARQLLSLARVLDFADATARNEAAALLQSQLLWGYSYRKDSATDSALQEAEAMELSMGGSPAWAQAMASFAREVYGEYSEQLQQVLMESLAKAGGPCREGGGTPAQWLHTLAVAHMALSSLPDMRSWKGLAMEPQELLNSLVLPAVQHPSAKVRKSAVECLGVYCSMSKEAARAHSGLLLSKVKGDKSDPVRVGALKAYIDVTLLYSLPHFKPAEGEASQDSPEGSVLDAGSAIQALMEFLPVPGQPSGGEDFDLDEEAEEGREQEGLVALACEGLAKALLWNPLHPKAADAMGAILLASFSAQLEDHWWTRQMIMSFLQRFSALPHCKELLKGLYVPLVRQSWPKGHRSSMSVRAETAARQRASSLSQLLVCMLKQEQIPTQQPGEGEEAEGEGGDAGDDASKAPTEFSRASGENSSSAGFEKLAFNIGIEMLTFPFSQCPAGKQYSTHLARVLASLPLASTSETRPLLVLAPRLVPVVQHAKMAQKDLASFTSRVYAVTGTDPESAPEAEDYEENQRRVEDFIAAALESLGTAGRGEEGDWEGSLAESRRSSGLQQAGAESTPAENKSRGGKASSAARRRRSKSNDPVDDYVPSSAAKRPSAASPAASGTPVSAARPSRQSKTNAASKLKNQLKTVESEESEGWNSGESGSEVEKSAGDSGAEESRGEESGGEESAGEQSSGKGKPVAEAGAAGQGQHIQVKAEPVRSSRGVRGAAKSGQQQQQQQQQSPSVSGGGDFESAGSPSFQSFSSAAGSTRSAAARRASMEDEEDSLVSATDWKEEEVEGRPRGGRKQPRRSSALAKESSPLVSVVSADSSFVASTSSGVRPGKGPALEEAGGNAMGTGSDSEGSEEVVSTRVQRRRGAAGRKGRVVEDSSRDGEEGDDEEEGFESAEEGDSGASLPARARKQAAARAARMPLAENFHRR